MVILDSGTTTTAILRAGAGAEFSVNLTIITNAVNIAAELSGSSLEVILTGGTLRKNSFSLVGPIAEETLRRLNADILFLGVDGFDVHYGLSTPNLLEAKVNRAMMDIARLAGRGLRLQQVRPQQPVFDCTALPFPVAPRNHRPRDSQARRRRTEENGNPGDAGVACIVVVHPEQSEESFAFC